MNMPSMYIRRACLALLALLLPATVALAQDFSKILEHAKERFTRGH